ncbi:hypothetical protein BLNAU_773 [Blattamonas nauphoetae]|uniref:Uncharacterized protein n=1 Tax=Blattamonas nauphoetae TaxID=2049346 RepID=A0ABQ9YKH0_9EUKA|nr:hypothetical protein BLNAU_773 [Blattamonas nauphoetae]
MDWKGEVFKVLDDHGVLERFRAQLKSSVKLALKGQSKELKPQNRLVVELKESAEYKTTLSLIFDSLQSLHLTNCAALFIPDTQEQSLFSRSDLVQQYLPELERESYLSGDCQNIPVLTYILENRHTSNHSQQAGLTNSTLSVSSSRPKYGSTNAGKRAEIFHDDDDFEEKEETKSRESDKDSPNNSHQNLPANKPKEDESEEESDILEDELRNKQQITTNSSLLNESRTPKGDFSRMLDSALEGDISLQAGSAASPLQHKTKSFSEDDSFEDDSSQHEQSPEGRRGAQIKPSKNDAESDSDAWGMDDDDKSSSGKRQEEQPQPKKSENIFEDSDDFDSDGEKPETKPQPEEPPTAESDTDSHAAQSESDKKSSDDFDDSEDGAFGNTIQTTKEKIVDPDELLSPEEKSHELVADATNPNGVTITETDTAMTAEERRAKFDHSEIAAVEDTDQPVLDTTKHSTSIMDITQTPEPSKVMELMNNSKEEGKATGSDFNDSDDFADSEDQKAKPQNSEKSDDFEDDDDFLTGSKPVAVAKREREPLPKAKSTGTADNLNFDFSDDDEPVVIPKAKSKAKKTGRIGGTILSGNDSGDDDEPVDSSYINFSSSSGGRAKRRQLFSKPKPKNKTKAKSAPVPKTSGSPSRTGTSSPGGSGSPGRRHVADEAEDISDDDF